LTDGRLNANGREAANKTLQELDGCSVCQDSLQYRLEERVKKSVLIM